MPSKKKKYNARFPAGRIKKIMQSDEEVGKVAQAVPIIISKTLELFVESLLEKTLRITNSRNAKTLSPSHMKQCIMAENRFDFLRELVKNIPDISVAEEIAHDQAPYDLSMPSTSGVIPSASAPPTPSPSTEYPSLRNGIELNSVTPPVQRSASVPAARSSGEQKRLQDLMSEMKNVSVNSTIQPHTSEKMSQIMDSMVHNASSKNSDRKRRHDDSISEMNSTVSANFYKENSVIQHTSDMLERSSPKMARIMDTTPIPHASNSSSTNSIRRLQHQSKSIPCTSKESHLSPMTPAPIINIDICNRPIVKIDYSNLALHDKEPIDCSASTEDQSLASGSCISPVINIDLSKITPQPSSSLQTILKDKATNSSSLDLDEDYDNI